MPGIRSFTRSIIVIAASRGSWECPEGAAPSVTLVPDRSDARVLGARGQVRGGEDKDAACDS